MSKGAAVAVAFICGLAVGFVVGLAMMKQESRSSGAPAMTSSEPFTPPGSPAPEHGGHPMPASMTPSPASP